MIAPDRGIEEFFRRRYGRESIYLPSGRFALYVAFREWLQPGDRILISPVTDDVVFFTVLAAELVPVIAPLDPGTGNLDPSAVPDAVWSRLAAVLTTNLYGIPDRMDLIGERCRRHGLLLIEDACQALDTRWDGQLVGLFGPVAVYSLAKHPEGAGAVLTFADGSRREPLLKRTRRELRQASLSRRMARLGLALARHLAEVTGSRSSLARVRDGLVPLQEEREGHRIPYEAVEVRSALRSGGGFDRFDPWARIDDHHYRQLPDPYTVYQTRRRLEKFEENCRRRREGTERIWRTGLTPPGFPGPPGFALFRVPLFVRERERVRDHCMSRGLRIDYIYDPPLDVYAGAELAERLPSPPEAIHWSRDVLPADPLRAGRFLSILKSCPTGVEAPRGIR